MQGPNLQKNIICPHCMQSISSSNFELHEARCAKVNTRPRRQQIKQIPAIPKHNYRVFNNNMQPNIFNQNQEMNNNQMQYHRIQRHSSQKSERPVSRPYHQNKNIYRKCQYCLKLVEKDQHETHEGECIDNILMESDQQEENSIEIKKQQYKYRQHTKPQRKPTIQTIKPPLDKNPIKSQQLKHECKICFFAECAMINKSCRHLMMCTKCYKQLRNKHGNNNKVPCPLCNTLGEYIQFIEPIYA